MLASRVNVKKKLRIQALAARSAMTVTERKKESARVCKQLKTLLEELMVRRLQAPATIAVYASMTDELDLSTFITSAYKKDNISICFPCMEPHGDQMMAMRRVANINYQAGNVPFINKPLEVFSSRDQQLLPYQRVNPKIIDFIVVPLVAFDDAGNRLGYGGGNYDRFLPLLRKDTVVIGVAFAAQRLDNLPVEAHDIPLKIIY